MRDTARPRSPRPVVDGFAVVLALGWTVAALAVVLAAAWRACGGG